MSADGYAGAAAAARSVFNCDTIPPEPNIFMPGFIPDILDKYAMTDHYLLGALGSKLSADTLALIRAIKDR